VDDLRFGSLIRALRHRRKWRQVDLAVAANVSRALISLIERGHLDRVALRTLRQIAGAMDVRLELLARWRGGELDRLMNAGHSAMHESIARLFANVSGWVAIPEVTFARHGERGVIDVLAWFPSLRLLLVIELKTDLVDVQALLGTVDRYRRIAAYVARERGWNPAATSVWVVLTDTRTNRRRVAAHQTVLRAAFPADGVAMRRWLRNPSETISALSFWSDGNRGSTSRMNHSRHRVRTTGRPSAPHATGMQRPKRSSPSG
jgi:transcriptional regulator with XRE-family HTH domain